MSNSDWISSDYPKGNDSGDQGDEFNVTKDDDDVTQNIRSEFTQKPTNLQLSCPGLYVHCFRNFKILALTRQILPYHPLYVDYLSYLKI